MTPFRRAKGGEFNLEAQHRAEDFGRGAIGQTLAWAIIELGGDSCNTLVTERREIGLPGKILADQTIGVLVGSALPTGIRIGEKGLEA